MKTVCSELGKVQHKAEKIGIQLGIPCSKMLEFKKEDDLLSLAIDYWLSENVPEVPITWKFLIKALESAHVGESGLARALATKYCSQQEESKDDTGQ